MNSADEKLLQRWLPRLADRSDEVKSKAIETLARVAVRNPECRNLIVPKILQVGRSAKEWMLALGFVTHSSEVSLTDTTWAEDFLEVYLSIAQANLSVASKAALESMVQLFEHETVEKTSPLVIAVYEFAQSQLERSADDYIREDLFALVDWYEDSTETDDPDGARSPELVQSTRWPTTHMSESQTSLNSVVFPVERGVLKTIGYAVGATNPSDSANRRELLRSFLLAAPSLPADHPQHKEWGRPASGARLLKLANTIAALTRHAKRRKAPPVVAIDEWESDLEYLRTTFYNEAHSFHWPSTRTGEPSDA